MANTKSATKNARKNVRRRARNLRVKTRLKTLAKNLTRANAAGDSEAVRAAAKVYISSLDKAAKKGIIHRNSASRHKAACARYLLAK